MYTRLLYIHGFLIIVIHYIFKGKSAVCVCVFTSFRTHGKFLIAMVCVCVSLRANITARTLKQHRYSRGSDGNAVGLYIGSIYTYRAGAGVRAGGGGGGGG